MTGEDLIEYRNKQKLRMVDIAWIAGVDVRQIHRWQIGEYPIPRSVELLLKAFAQGKINARWLVRNIKEPIPYISPPTISRPRTPSQAPSHSATAK